MNILAAVLIFGIVVAFHEFGHFIIAKANGIGVVEFSIGMGPRLFSFDKGGTKYSLKLLPIGGSCMMLGEDGTLDAENAFNNKNVWQRISVIFAGPFFNFILAFIFAMVIIGIVGYDPAIITSISENQPAYEAGLREGDLITEINGKNIYIGRELATYLELEGVDGSELVFEYERDGKKYEASYKPEYIKNYMLGFYYTNDENEAAINSVVEDYPLDNAGIVAGDVIVAINGTEIKSGAEVADYFAANPLSEEELTVSYKRGEQIYETAVTPKFESEGYTLGFSYNYNYRVKANFLEVIKYSFFEVRYWITTTIKTLGQLVTMQIGAENIGGPVRIVSEIGNVIDESKEDGALYVMLNLLNWTILLSANLGVMNLLPLPALDGGRLLFMFIEVVRGKPINPEKEGMVHFVGIVLLMLLMVFVFFNDIRNVFF